METDHNIKKALLILREYFKLHGIKPQDVAKGAGISSDAVCKIFSFVRSPSQIELKCLVEFYGKIYGSPVSPADYFHTRAEYLKHKYAVKDRLKSHSCIGNTTITQQEAEEIQTTHKDIERTIPTISDNVEEQQKEEEERQEGVDLLLLFNDFIEQTHRDLNCKRAAVELVVKIFASKRKAKDLCRMYGVPQSFVKNIRNGHSQRAIVLALKDYLSANGTEEQETKE